METVGVEPNGIDAKTFILRHFCVSVSISVSIIKKRAMPDRSQTPPPQEENRHDTECPPYRRSHSKHILIASRRLLIPVVPASSPSLHGAIQP